MKRADTRFLFARWKLLKIFIFNFKPILCFINELNLTNNLPILTFSYCRFAMNWLRYFHSLSSLRFYSFSPSHSTLIFLIFALSLLSGSCKQKWTEGCVGRVGMVIYRVSNSAGDKKMSRSVGWTTKRIMEDDGLMALGQCQIAPVYPGPGGRFYLS